MVNALNTFTLLFHSRDSFGPRSTLWVAGLPVRHRAPEFPVKEVIVVNKFEPAGGIRQSGDTLNRRGGRPAKQLDDRIGMSLPVRPHAPIKRS